ncbi:hypothetical protein N7532_010285 [Penicillium argentinense]|uniref:Zn(2)-C6 fungal-type domain-containing protein n=1 Tax=Penicillium argentinense TaxID=1131581 RepID=A0A9W9JXH5_9EURO|nr:uncharacterized protein N7532_010285 [Penicillium argentinense]KAJ5085514.1 hypothetical protein N7532_010285 [Penicillium argentinense]
MRTSRYSTSRQKACRTCSSAKAKCDRQAGGCTRCAQRGLDCDFGQQHASTNNTRQADSKERLPCSPASLSDSLVTSNFGDGSSTIEGASLSSLPSPGTMASTIVQGSPNAFPSTQGRAPVVSGGAGMAFPQSNLDFTRLDLACPINVDEINSRWMNAYIPDPQQQIKRYPPSIISFIHRIFKSYVAAAIRGRGLLPFVHPAQMKHQTTTSPLTTCLSLIRMCQNPLPRSEGVAAAIFQREMDTITQSRESYDDLSLLAAFQAYLIYAMVLFFRLGITRHHSLRQTMMTLQELAHASSRGGLVCVADQTRTRPRWEEWIVAEAKRRTIYTMYLFDSVVSTQENLPTYLGTELQGLPAPAAGSIWEASSRPEWEQAYNLFLAEWMGPGLAIDELWPIPPDLDGAGVARRRGRVDHWLEDVDSYGTMLYAVVSCTHGG